MDEQVTTYDFFGIFETVRIPLVITNSSLNLIYANPFARTVLPLSLQSGERIDVDELLQHEDSIAFDHMVAECLERGESIGTLKQKGIDKYFKVKAYFLKNRVNEIVFHFEDVSQSRILEDQLYEHLVDLYSQLESQEREIADLKAIILRTSEDSPSSF